MHSPLTHSLLADLLDCNKTNSENPNAMIPSVIDQVKVGFERVNCTRRFFNVIACVQGTVHFVHAKDIIAFNHISNQFLRCSEAIALL